jgi:transcriptional regulator with XRE-family HTH domain
MIVFNPNKIRQLMNERRNEDKAFRQTLFLKDIQLSLTGLNNILDGKSFPGVDTLLRIATFFGKDMNFFFENENKNETYFASMPIEIYEPPKDLAACYKIMYEQQKEITELTREVEILKNGHAPTNGARNAG